MRLSPTSHRWWSIERFDFWGQHRHIAYLLLPRYRQYGAKCSIWFKAEILAYKQLVSQRKNPSGQ
jgi:hypothetical protein